MAAGQGFKTFTTGEVLTAADVNGYLMQGINVFASSAARSAAITSPQEGQYSFLKDTNALEYYDGAAWVGAPVGDITAVTAGKGLTGGGSSGDVTVSLATTAKGDLVAGSGASTAAVLTVGNNGETLVADSSTSTGLRYQAPIQQNPFLNSAFQVFQRGTSISVSTGSRAYTADRWELNAAGTNNASTVSQQATGDTTNLPNIQYCARVQRNSGQTGTGGHYFTQSMETVNAIPFAGKSVVVSFYARKGANYSPTNSELGAGFYSGTGTDQNKNSSYTGNVYVGGVTATLTTTWQRFTFTGTVGATATELALQFSCAHVGTAGAADYFEVTGVQLEVGSVATPFHTYAGTLQGELAACQRYYWRATAQTGYSNICFGYGATSTVIQTIMNHPVQMRTTPTSIDYLNIAAYDGTTVYGSVTSIGINTATLLTSSTNINYASGITVGKLYSVLSNNTTNSYIGFSAEL